MGATLSPILSVSTLSPRAMMEPAASLQRMPWGVTGQGLPGERVRMGGGFLALAVTEMKKFVWMRVE